MWPSETRPDDISEKNEESPDRPRDSTTPVDDATLLTDEEGRSDAVKYDRLGVYLIEALRDQRDRIEELATENAELHERLAAIEAHVDVDTGREGVADD